MTEYVTSQMHATIRNILTGVLFALGLQVAVLAEDGKPLTYTFKHKGNDRIYSVFLPKNFDPDATYWPLVFVHGGGGRGETSRFAMGTRQVADKVDFPAIVIAPDFINARNVSKDKNVSRFPMLGEGEFLKSVLEEVRGKYNLHSKILLSGYSMGGQFTHRFALGNPDLVQACAPQAAGTWTTPDGRLLIPEYGEVKNPEAFLSSKKNATKLPSRLSSYLSSYFEARVAQVAGRPAAKGAEKIPFLVMCGTLDPRWSIAKEFASSLEKSGFHVETAWPVTPHRPNRPNDGKYSAEFAKYPWRAIEFFTKHTKSKP